MIIWISSYPKSGNTWVRALLSSYFYSKDGNFHFDLLEQIKEFPKHSDYLNEISVDRNLAEIAKEWIPAQRKLNLKHNNSTFFLKTHSAICNVEGSDFTDKENTLGAIYVVRDPRNVILSLSNHFDYSIEKSLEMICNKKQIITNPTKENRYFGFTVVSDWQNHYRTWKNFKLVEVKIVKYEDLILSPKNTFISILNFINKFMQVDIDEDRIKNVLMSTEFSKLQQSENKNGFKESSNMSGFNKKFFNLGTKNDWKNLLKKEIKEKIENHFKEEMKELGYL